MKTRHCNQTSNVFCVFFMSIHSKVITDTPNNNNNNKLEKEKNEREREREREREP